MGRLRIYILDFDTLRVFFCNPFEKFCKKYDHTKIGVKVNKNETRNTKERKMNITPNQTKEKIKELHVVIQ